MSEPQTTQTPALPGGARRGGDFAGGVKRFFERYDDGEILRWAFRGLLVGTISVLALDYFELQNQAPASTETIDPMQTATPVLPPAVDGDEPAGGIDPRPFLKTDQTLLRRTMQFTLESGGVLKAEGTIEPGTAVRLATELQARGEYVKTVSFNSPGGALEDAIEMGRMIRAHSLNTEVTDGALCASSCPLAFAGGKKRFAGEKSGVGVHQFYAVATPEKPQVAAAQAMSDAQTTTARITRHLEEMGVNPAVWLHAMDTPPRSLYYFSQDELARFQVVTAKPNVAARMPGSG